MKEYKIVFNVPDDFVPEELELNVSYDGDVELTSEGFVDNTDIKEAVSKISIDAEPIPEGSVVLFKFPADLDPETVNTVKNVLEEQLPDVTILGITDNVDLLVQNSGQAIQMLEGMIDKVKTRASILQK